MSRVELGVPPPISTGLKNNSNQRQQANNVDAAIERFRTFLDSRQHTNEVQIRNEIDTLTSNIPPGDKVEFLTRIYTMLDSLMITEYRQTTLQHIRNKITASDNQFFLAQEPVFKKNDVSQEIINRKTQLKNKETKEQALIEIKTKYEASVQKNKNNANSSIASSPRVLANVQEEEKEPSQPNLKGLNNDRSRENQEFMVKPRSNGPRPSAPYMAGWSDDINNSSSIPSGTNDNSQPGGTNDNSQPGGTQVIQNDTEVNATMNATVITSNNTSVPQLNRTNTNVSEVQIEGAVEQKRDDAVEQKREGTDNNQQPKKVDLKKFELTNKERFKFTTTDDPKVTVLTTVTTLTPKEFADGMNQFIGKHPGERVFINYPANSNQLPDIMNAGYLLSGSNISGGGLAALFNDSLQYLSNEAKEYLFVIPIDTMGGNIEGNVDSAIKMRRKLSEQKDVIFVNLTNNTALDKGQVAATGGLNSERYIVGSSYDQRLQQAFMGSANNQQQ